MSTFYSSCDWSRFSQAQFMSLQSTVKYVMIVRFDDKKVSQCASVASTCFLLDKSVLHRLCQMVARCMKKNIYVKFIKYIFSKSCIFKIYFTYIISDIFAKICLTYIWHIFKWRRNIFSIPKGICRIYISFPWGKYLKVAHITLDVKSPISFPNRRIYYHIFFGICDI